MPDPVLGNVDPEPVHALVAQGLQERPECAPDVDHRCPRGLPEKPADDIHARARCLADRLEVLQVASPVLRLVLGEEVVPAVADAARGEVLEVCHAAARALPVGPVGKTGLHPAPRRGADRAPRRPARPKRPDQRGHGVRLLPREAFCKCLDRCGEEAGVVQEPAKRARAGLTQPDAGNPRAAAQQLVVGAGMKQDHGHSRGKGFECRDAEMREDEVILPQLAAQVSHTPALGDTGGNVEVTESAPRTTVMAAAGKNPSPTSMPTRGTASPSRSSPPKLTRILLVLPGTPCLLGGSPRRAGDARFAPLYPAAAGEGCRRGRKLPHGQDPPRPRKGRAPARRSDRAPPG